MPASSYSVDQGTALTLTPTPKSGYKFVVWTEGDTTITSPLEVTMNSNKTIGTTFITALVEEVLVAGGSFPRHVDYNNPNSTAFDITLSPFYMGTIEVHQKSVHPKITQSIPTSHSNPTLLADTNLPIEAIHP